jgi:hypothetical protein
MLGTPVIVDPVRAIRCIPDEFRILGRYTVPPATETCPVGIEVGPIGTHENTTRSIRPPVLIKIASLFQGQ